VKDNYSIDFLT